MKSQVVSFRVTSEEKAKLDKMGGATKVLRSLLSNLLAESFIKSFPPDYEQRFGPIYIRWNNGTVGPNYTEIVTSNPVVKAIHIS